MIFIILDPKSRKFEIKGRNDKIGRFVTCQIMGGLSEYICIQINDKQNDKKIYKYLIKYADHQKLLR